MPPRSLILGNRIPRDYFITWGFGESDVSIHAGSYDDALKHAHIENCNVITYSSVMPPEAREVPRPERIHHGAVLETIQAEISGAQGEILTAGLITWKVQERSEGVLLGGFVAEYAGHASEETARQNLEEAMGGMNERRGYAKEHHETTGVRIVVKSFSPKRRYGTVIVAIGFTAYIWPILE
jgi:arginine decarboxylase